MTIKKVILIWLAIVFLPVIFWFSKFLFGLLGLKAYLGYYFPLRELGEPFFIQAKNLDWYYPTLYGKLITAVIYSVVYWIIFLIIKPILRHPLKKNLMVVKIIKKTILFTLLLFIPIVQLYPTLIAFPLFLFPEINKSMAWVFIYFYPKSFLTLIIFVIYYFLVFYIYELIKKYI